MTPVFIFEPGIRPWEESKPPSDAPFATVSIVVSAQVELLTILNSLLPALGGVFTSWFRWHTVRHVFDGNAIQRRKLINSLNTDAGQFRHPVVREHEDVLFSVANLVLPITVFELETLSDYQREHIIGSKDTHITPGMLSSSLAPYAKGADPASLAELLTSWSPLALGRLFEDPDTHSAFQWFGCESDMRLLAQSLDGLNITSLTSRNDVSELLSK